MELPLFLARAWGFFFFLVCLGFLINKKGYTALLKNLQNDFSVLMAGIFALFVGIVQVVAYDNWSFSWEGLVTLIGWIALLKGLLILFVPGYMEKFAKKSVKGNWYTIPLVVGIIIGIYLISASYMNA